MGCKQSKNAGADGVDEPQSTSPQKPKETQNGKSDNAPKVKNLPSTIICLLSICLKFFTAFHISQGDFVKSKTTKFRDEYVVNVFGGRK